MGERSEISECITRHNALSTMMERSLLFRDSGRL